MFNARQRNWSVELLAALEIDPGWLSQTFADTAVTGTLSPAVTQATGLPPVVQVRASGGGIKSAL